MAGQQSNVSAEAASRYSNLRELYMGQGMAGLKDENQLIARGLEAGGQLQGTAGAFDTQRAMLTDQGTAGQLGAIQQGLGGQEAGRDAGRESFGISGGDYGAKLAAYLGKSRLSQGMSSIEQMGNLMGMQLGQQAQAGSASMGAAGQDIRSISMLPNYNQNYANILGGLNAAGSIYGAGNQAGWWNNGSGMPNVNQTGYAASSNPFGAGSFV